MRLYEQRTLQDFAIMLILPLLYQITNRIEASLNIIDV